MCDPLPTTILHADADDTSRGWAAARQWQAMFDTVGDAVCLLNHAGTVLRCNRGFAALLGKPFAEIVGRPCPEPLYGATAESGESPVLRAFGSGHRETAELRLAGRFFLARADPLPRPSGKLAELVLTLSDVTERLAIETALQETDQLKEVFLAQMVHELRGPLAPLLNALHVLQLTPDLETASQARAIAQRQVRHLSRLLDDLLEVSQIARGQVRLHRERLDLARLAAQAVESARPLIEVRRHMLTVQLPPEPLYVEGDPARLLQVLSNLLSNAARYTPAGGEVHLLVDGGAGEVLVKVRDTGIGLEPTLLPRIFDLFVQGKDGSEDGLGISLHLVRGLVELHGGKIEAHSGGRGQGSEFVVRLPAK